jgi:hypothetical protein
LLLGYFGPVPGIVLVLLRAVRPLRTGRKHCRLGEQLVNLIFGHRHWNNSSVLIRRREDEFASVNDERLAGRVTCRIARQVRGVFSRRSLLKQMYLHRRPGACRT